MIPDISMSIAPPPLREVRSPQPSSTSTEPQGPLPEPSADFAQSFTEADSQLDSIDDRGSDSGEIAPEAEVSAEHTGNEDQAIDPDAPVEEDVEAESDDAPDDEDVEAHSDHPHDEASPEHEARNEQSEIDANATPVVDDVDHVADEVGDEAERDENGEEHRNDEERSETSNQRHEESTNESAAQTDSSVERQPTETSTEAAVQTTIATPSSSARNEESDSARQENRPGEGGVRTAEVTATSPRAETTPQSSGREETSDRRRSSDDARRPSRVSGHDVSAREPAGSTSSSVQSPAATASPVSTNPIPFQELSPVSEKAAPQIETKLDAAEASRPQMVRGAMAMTRTNGGSMTIKLNPEALGSLRIQMSITSGRVSIQFHTETPEARSLLQQTMNQLRQALESQGLKLEQVTMQPLNRSAGQNASGQSNDSSNPQNDSEKQDAGDGRSRGRFDREDEGDPQSAKQDSGRNSDQSNSGESWREAVETATQDTDGNETS